MKSYEPDSTVDAAILCEYGVFSTTSFTFQWTTRYKIFSKEGLNRLIMSVPVASKGEVKGVVFNIEDGKIVKTKLDRKSIYRERVVEDYYRMRIAPPDARAGSVIDITFSMQGLPNTWQFQKKIPVFWSELVIPKNPYISFNKRFVGYEPLQVVTSSRWVAKEMPPFHPEPYINSSNNYMTTMFLEISSIHLPGSGYSTGIYENLSEDWDDVAEYYDDHTKFGEVLRVADIYLNGAADTVDAISASETEKVVNALNRIRDEVKWNKRQRLYPSTQLRSVYVKEKTGSSADMNFLFLKLLEKLDIECYPMLMSLRDEGMINPHFPSHSRFNYVVSYVKIGDRYYTIDAADKHYPYDMLNAECLNNFGFVLWKETGEWVDIAPEKKRSRMINATLSVEEDGLLTGSMTIQHAGYASALFRKRQERYTTRDEYLEEFETDHTGTFVMDYSVENLEQDVGSVKENFSLEIEGKTNVAGGLIYLDPVLIGRITENPFKLESREYPVDYTYPRDKMYILTLAVPDGYAVEQMPAPIKLITREKSIMYQFNAVQTQNSIQIMCRMSILKPMFIQTEYSELQALYDIVVNKESEPIILKKVTP